MNKLLINYVPGARGDFLANVLIGNFTERIFRQFKLDTPHYIKMHGLHDIYSTDYRHRLLNKLTNFDEVFTYCETNKIKTVKIIPGSITDLIDIAYFDRLKNWRKTPDVLEICGSFGPIYQDYLTNIPYYDRYNYVVKFNELWDVSILNDLFREFHHREFSTWERNMIQHQLTLQIRHSQDFMKQYQDYELFQKAIQGMEF